LVNRRHLLSAGLATGAAAGLGAGFAPLVHAAREEENPNNNILVVVELSGGNDGLNTLVPYGDDAYYRARPNLGIPADKLLKVDDHFGFNPGALGLQRLWESGDLAVVHGCGYEDPSYSHFTSMGYWHTGAPHSGEAYGWMGRLADALAPDAPANYLVNVAANQSLAVNSRRHVPVVFDDPERFQRDAFAHQQAVLAQAATPALAGDSGNSTRDFLRAVASSAVNSSSVIRQACQNYQTPIDYGIAPLDLQKVAACIASGLPPELYYVSFRNNAFDTHVQQGALHQRLLSYAADAIHGFVRDLQRLGLDKRVTLVAFSEFGRRLGENANLGTDHGSANLMFVAGSQVNGGHYGELPDLEDLNAEDNLKHTTDFRQVYASVMDGWLGKNQSTSDRGPLSARVLGAEYAAFDLFERSAS